MRIGSDNCAHFDDLATLSHKELFGVADLGFLLFLFLLDKLQLFGEKSIHGIKNGISSVARRIHNQFLIYRKLELAATAAYIVLGDRDQIVANIIIALLFLLVSENLGLFFELCIDELFSSMKNCIDL